MIIWTRWGIIGFLFVGIGVGIGFLLFNLFGFGGVKDSALTGMFIGLGLMISAGLLWLLETQVIRPKWDRPRPIYVTEQLAEPVQDAEGRVHTHRQVPAVHPQTGAPIMYSPTSSLFFIPLKFWPYVLLALGAVVAVVNLVSKVSS